MWELMLEELQLTPVMLRDQVSSRAPAAEHEPSQPRPTRLPPASPPPPLEAVRRGGAHGNRSRRR